MHNHSNGNKLRLIMQIKHALRGLGLRVTRDARISPSILSFAEMFLFVSDEDVKKGNEREWFLTDFVYSSRAIWLNVPFLFIVLAITVFDGMVIFATYAGCDLLTTRKIARGDQVNTSTTFLVKTLPLPKPFKLGCSYPIFKDLKEPF